MTHSQDRALRLPDAYARAAGRYARWVAPRFRPLARHLLAHPTTPPAPGLDVGSGTGAVVREWRALVPAAWLVALDATPGMLACQDRHADERVAGDAAALPFAAQTFRAVCTAFVLHHLPAPESALAEWLRVLVPDGELRVATWANNQPTLWDAFDDAARALGYAPDSPPTASPLDTGQRLGGAAIEAGFGSVSVERQTAAFEFADARAYWRWRTAFPGAERIIARLSPRERGTLRDLVQERFGRWPGPLVSTHDVLYLRARRPRR
jgi:SAM-dependent methyltransferase